MHRCAIHTATDSKAVLDKANMDKKNAMEKVEQLMKELGISKEDTEMGRKNEFIKGIR